MMKSRHRSSLYGEKFKTLFQRCHHWVKFNAQRLLPQSTPKKCNTLDFLEFPLDIILLINDELSFTSKVHLSQTCQAMRNAIYHRCISAAKRDPVPQECVAFLIEAASHLVDVVVCVSCRKLHEAIDTDGPYFGELHERIHHKNCCRGDYTMTITKGRFYTLSNYHVHLAVKLARLTKGQNTYLQRIMAPHHESFVCWVLEVTVRSLILPKVKNGRFLLMTKTTTYPHSFDPALADLSQISWRQKFCEHIDYLIIKKDPALTSIFRSAIKETGMVRGGCCSLCGADFQMRFINGKLTCWTWQDFGTGRSPKDPVWKINTGFNARKIKIRPYIGDARRLFELG